MKKEQDKWAENLRRRMEDYSEPLPDGLWERIEQDLPSSHVLSFWKTRRFAVAVAAAVVAVSSVSIWLMTSYRLSTVGGGKNMAENIASPSDYSSKDDMESVGSDRNEAIEDIHYPAGKLLSEHQLGSKAMDLLLVSAADTVHEGEESCTVAAEESVDLEPLSTSTEGKSRDVVERRSWRKQVEADRRKMEQNHRDLAEVRTETGKSSWSFGVAAGNTPSSSASMNEMDYLLSRTSMSGALMMASPDVFSSNGQTEKRYASEKEAEVNHKMPVSVGASVKWEFSERWSVESGLYYTFLSSEIHNQSSPEVEEKQRLHYIGIPLKVQRMIWKNNRWTVYASAGAMVEKCVKATRDISYNTNNVPAYVLGNNTYASGIPATSGVPSFMPELDGNGVDSWDYSSAAFQGAEHSSFHISRLQYSISAAVGAQLNFSKHVGLYIEPGATYYFNDGSGVETIRKEHPLNFSLQMGIRFNVLK